MIKTLLSRERRPLRRMVAALLLAGLIATAYARTWHAGFIWDDEAHLTENPCIVGPLGFADIWTSARAVYYPLVLTVFWLVHAVAGLSPLPYHLLNVAWHIVAALLLWRVLEQLQVRGAWLGATFWALHPVAVQSVAWITEMKNTQSAAFYLLATSLFLHWRNERRACWYGLALLSFAAAITSKPSTVMLPAILLVCLWWRERHRPGWPEIWAIVPFAMISLTASAWTIWEQKFHAGAQGAEWVQLPLARILISARAIWFYLAKLAWPRPLIFIYPRWTADLSRVVSYLPLLCLVLLVAVLWVGRERGLRPLTFAFACFVLTLFPVLDFFDVYFFRYSFVSDHFQYLASMAPLALAASGVASFTPRRNEVFLAVTLIALLWFLSFRQTANYRNVFSLYRATLADNPHCWMADYNLGIALKNNGQLDGAIDHYEKAIALRSDYADAHYNLARALVEKGELAKALAHYKRVLEIAPNDADAHNNYAGALQQLGRRDEARQEYVRAIALQPSAVDARRNLAAMLLREGRSEQAVAQLQEASRWQRRDAVLWKELGNALLKAGRTREAGDAYTAALQLAPNEAGALDSYAWLLATANEKSLRNGSRAVELAKRANNLSGGKDPVVLHTLAASYAEAGEFQQATTVARRAIELSMAAGNKILVQALQDELALYELGLAYHQAAR